MLSIALLLSHQWPYTLSVCHAILSGRDPLWAMITDIHTLLQFYMLLKTGRPQGYPRVFHCGGTTGQVETIRDGPGPGRVRGYL